MRLTRNKSNKYFDTKLINTIVIIHDNRGTGKDVDHDNWNYVFTNTFFTGLLFTIPYR